MSQETTVLGTKWVQLKNNKFGLALLYTDKTWEVIFDDSMFLDHKVFEETDAKIFLGKSQSAARELAEELMCKTKYICRFR